MVWYVLGGSREAAAAAAAAAAQQQQVARIRIPGYVRGGIKREME
jgi:hypothetical protein